MARFATPTLLASILFFGTIVRIWGIDHDLPYIYHPDEPTNIEISQRMFRNSDANPHFFNYPSFLFDLNSIAYIFYYAIGKFDGTYRDRTDISPLVSLGMGVTKAPDPSYVLLGRMLTMVFGVGTIALLFLVGKQLAGRTSLALVASLMYAILPTSVQLSRYITPDTLATFFEVASLSAAILVYREGRMWQYVLAGLLAGLAASAKYNAAVIVIVPAIAHFLRTGEQGFKQTTIYVAALSCGIGFLLATPFALLDFTNFVTALRFVGRQYASHPGMEGDPITWYLGYMWQTAGVIYVLAILEIVRSFYTRSKEVLLLSIFPVVYFLFVCSFEVRNDRTLLPLTPFACLLASAFLVQMWTWAGSLRAVESRRFAFAIVAVIACIGVTQPADNTIAATRQLTMGDGRATARVWIANNLPPGSKIAIESYAPFVESSSFSVAWVRRMIDHDPAWYKENAFEYLVFAEGMYGRFYRDANRYAEEVSRYQELFERFKAIKTFSDGDYEVRIYKVQ